MKDSSRRSFVKTSAATGLTFTFAGLIRAHGQSGGGNTTWNPEGTFFSTNSGETTTYDPNGTYVTTDPGVTTTWDPDVTTMPETTMPEETTTVQTTTSEPSRTVLISIIVEFTGTANHQKFNNSNPDPGFSEWSGRVFEGTLTYYLKNCLTGVITPITCNVKTGGYRVSDKLKGPSGMPSSSQNLSDDFWGDKPWESGSDTAWPPGGYDLATTIHTGSITGFRPNKVDAGVINTVIEGKNCQRELMKVHYRARRNGSSGCIVFTDLNQWNTFKDWMYDRTQSCPKSSCPRRQSGEAGKAIGCVGVDFVPMLVNYTESLLPVYKLSSGAISEATNPDIPIAIPAE